MKTIYLLIAITAGGHVDHSTYQTSHQCDEAAGIALYGETVEKFKKIEADIAREEKDYRESFYKAHPPRKPKDKAEEETIEQTKNINFKGGRSFGSSWAPCSRDQICGMSVTNNYLIQDEPGFYIGNGISYPFFANSGEWIQYVHGKMVIKHSTDIKTAECVKTTK